MCLIEKSQTNLNHFLANFALPEEGEDSPFKEIIFTELAREEAAKLVADYNKVILYL